MGEHGGDRELARESCELGFGLDGWTLAGRGGDEDRDPGCCLLRPSGWLLFKLGM